MKIAIYQTSDLHGHVFPTNYVEYKNLGALKILSFIDKDKDNYDKSLMIDCGDLIQGSAMTNYLAKHKSNNNPVVDLLSDFGFDAFVLGNHEFNYGLDYLEKSYKKHENKLLNANIEGLNINSKPYEIFDFDGYKIGVIGLTTSYIPNWEQKETIKNLKFLNPVEVYGKYENELKDKSDYIIAAYHGGFEKSIDGLNIPTEKLTKENQASELLETYSSIDAILSGHQHRSFVTKLNEVICTQPLNNGQTFSRIILDTQTGQSEVDLIEVENIGGEINYELATRFNDLNKKLESYLDTPIGKFDKDILLDDLFEARLKGHPYVNFLHEVQLDSSDAEISVVSIFDQAIGFKKDVSIRDVLVNYPYPNTLKVLEVPGDKLIEAMEKSVSYFELDQEKNLVINKEFLIPKKKNYNYDMFYGISYEIDLTKEFGNRLFNVKINNEDFDINKKYKVVMNNYRATNPTVYQAYMGLPELKDINLDMSELIINYFQNNKKIYINNNKNYIFHY